MNKQLKEVIAYLKKGYGKKCKLFSLYCSTCVAWITIDFLEEEIEINEDNLRRKI